MADLTALTLAEAARGLDEKSFDALDLLEAYLMYKY